VKLEGQFAAVNQLGHSIASEITPLGGAILLAVVIFNVGSVYFARRLSDGDYMSALVESADEIELRSGAIPSRDCAKILAEMDRLRCRQVNIGRAIIRNIILLSISGLIIPTICLLIVMSLEPVIFTSGSGVFENAKFGQTTTIDKILFILNELGHQAADTLLDGVNWSLTPYTQNQNNWVFRVYNVTMYRLAALGFVFGAVGEYSKLISVNRNRIPRFSKRLSKLMENYKQSCGDPRAPQCELDLPKLPEIIPLRQKGKITQSD
jgi:hypothetical protein